MLMCTKREHFDTTDKVSTNITEGVESGGKVW